MIFIVGGKCQGKTAYAKSFEKKGYTIVDDYQDCVKELMKSGENPEEKMKTILSSIPQNTIYVSAELGCGIVPIDAFERAYREENGRINCMLAQNADVVIRMVCGIPTVIKGELP